MKRYPPKELTTALYRAKAQIEDAAQILNWYLEAGNRMTQAELEQLTEARTQLLRVMVG